MAENENYYDLSDDEISNMSSPNSVKKEEETEDIKQEDEIVIDTQDDSNASNNENISEEGEINEEVKDDSEGDVGNQPDVDTKSDVFNEPDDSKNLTQKSKEPVKKEPEASKVNDETKENSKETKTQTDDKKSDEKPVESKTNYEDFYNKIMTPFRANGKEIKLNSPEEAIQLMQMGANYTKKLQQLAPKIKQIKMLENAGLLSDSKITYLIDLDKKNPEAIKKLLKDSKIDPLDIDLEKENTYRPGNYTVSDKQIEMENVVEELQNSAEGKLILVTVDKEWDIESKQAIFKDPKILTSLTNHKASGLYDVIMEEVEKQTILGHLSNTSKLDAYYKVGKILAENGTLQKRSTPEVKEEISEPKIDKVIERKTAENKKPITNEEQVKATSPVRTTPSNSNKQNNKNVLSLSDEEFEKTSSLRNLNL